MEYILFILAYLIGSIPFSIAVGKIAKGIDVRDYGSGNPGTTNAFRVLGKKLGFLVFFLDVLKGGFMIIVLRILYHYSILEPGYIPLLAFGLAAAIGHIYPIFIGFKGGKAVATSVGIFLAYAPLLGILGLLAYVVTLIALRYVSVASCTGALTLWVSTLVVYFFGPVNGSALAYMIGQRGDLIMPVIATLGTSLILFRHRKNFLNIKKGIEPKSNFMAKNKVDNRIERP